MKLSNCTKMRLVLVGFVAAVVLGGGSAKADFTFGEPTNLGPAVNGPYEDGNGLGISADGLSLYFGSGRPGGSGGLDIWMSIRATTDDPWGEPVNLGTTVNSSSRDTGGHISSDGLELYFTSERPGGCGGRDIWVATRETTGEDWATPVNLGSTVNTADADGACMISGNGLELYFISWGRPGGYGGFDIWLTRRSTKDSAWEEPENLGPKVNSSSLDADLSISSDGLKIFFGSNRSGGLGGGDLWMSMRATTVDPWGEPVNLGPTVNSSSWEGPTSLSADGANLYFRSNRPGGFGSYDIWQAPIVPIVDFNGDGKVDTADLVMLIDAWGTADRLYDIGPMPWGDGMVDIEDLKVFIKYWEQENRPGNPQSN